jgi:hypothetical protein
LQETDGAGAVQRSRGCLHDVPAAGKKGLTLIVSKNTAMDAKYDDKMD